MTAHAETPNSVASTHPNVVIPDQSVVSYLFDALAPDADRTALIDSVNGRRVTFGELHDLVDRFAFGIRQRVGVGDVVALLAPNSTEFVVGFLGTLRAGAVVTPVNALATSKDVARQAIDAGARLVLTVSSMLEVATAAAEIAELSPDAVVTLDNSARGPGVLGEFATLPRLEGEPVGSPSTHLAVLPYSSGTTSQPKGVMLTHRNLVANVCQIEGLLGVDDDSALLGVLPFSHIYGMTVVLNLALRRRATIVTMARFALAPALSLVASHHITHLFVAPPIILALGKDPEVDQHDLSSVRLVLSGAAPLDEVLASSVADRLGCRVRQAYGMSEMSPVSHLAPLDMEAPLASVGWTVPNMSIRLVDVQTGADIGMPVEGTSGPGELCCAGPNIMAGYLGNEAATRDSIDADGYLHTGDVATISSTGVVTIVDRLKELIKYKGYQVAPAELEGLLLTHPHINDAAVIGVTQSDTGDEWPKAFVVPTPGRSLEADDVLAFVDERVAPYKRVRIVEFVDAIPKSPSGKILRRELRTTTA